MLIAVPESRIMDAAACADVSPPQTGGHVPGAKARIKRINIECKITRTVAKQLVLF